jgi:hypothetical protein
MYSQEQDNWCWSAVAVSVAQHYNSATTWTRQCDVASHELAKTCCPPGSNTACDVPWYLDQALTRVGHYNTWASGTLTLDEIRAEIDVNHPVGARIGWSGGGGHFVVISGYSRSSAGEFVTIDDPIFGHSILTLATFTSAYQSTGNWTHSYWTQP